MQDTGAIREHMEVLGPDGGHVGKVDRVRGGEIELAQLDLGSGLKHHLIPTSCVHHDDDHGRLTLTRDEARTRWSEPHQPGVQSLIPEGLTGPCRGP